MRLRSERKITSMTKYPGKRQQISGNFVGRPSRRIAPSDAPLARLSHWSGKGKGTLPIPADGRNLSDC